MSIVQDQIIDEYVGVFHVVELIGHGAMGSVYRAFDTYLERDVAIKIPAPKYAQKPKFVKKFRREAKALGRLSHDNIVKIYTTGEYKGSPYIVLEYVDGPSLSSVLAERGRLKVGEAVEYMVQVCDAADYAHRMEVIHRDLKPSNILSESSGRALVADFGIAKILSDDSKDMTATFVGTPMYMSPEQCSDMNVDNRSDIYSLGTIFYEMIVGKPLLSGKTPAEILLKQITDPPKVSLDERMDLAPEIRGIIKKMLARDPDERYPDARSVVSALESYRNGGGSFSRVKREQKEQKKQKKVHPLVLCYIPQKILEGAVLAALKNVGHEFISVSDPCELFENLGHSTLRLVILSHIPESPEVFSLARKIREEKEHVKIMLLGHKISHVDVMNAIQSGVNEVVAEPFDPSIVIPKMESILIGRNTGTEHRKFFRIDVSEKMKMTVESEILDIGESGMRIVTNTALKMGEIFSFQSETLKSLGFDGVTGGVVWVSNSYKYEDSMLEAGISFVNFTAHDRDILRKWILEKKSATREAEGIH